MVSDLIRSGEIWGFNGLFDLIFAALLFCFAGAILPLLLSSFARPCLLLSCTVLSFSQLISQAHCKASSVLLIWWN
jgi:hypothetical protein